MNLGDKVRDPVTGIEGIAYAKAHYLQGCDRIGIQQPAFKDKEGNTVVPDLWFVDEPQLIVVKDGVVRGQDSVSIGGPSRFEKSGKR
jgi:hypothetical protein